MQWIDGEVFQSVAVLHLVVYVLIRNDTVVIVVFIAELGTLVTAAGQN